MALRWSDGAGRVGAREIATPQEKTAGIMVEKLNHCDGDGKEEVGEPSPRIAQHNEKKGTAYNVINCESINEDVDHTGPTRALMIHAGPHNPKTRRELP